jgi:hypothetical protein
MMDHYDSDPALGCGLMLVSAAFMSIIIVLLLMWLLS